MAALDVAGKNVARLPQIWVGFFLDSVVPKYGDMCGSNANIDGSTSKPFILEYYSTPHWVTTLIFSRCFTAHPKRRFHGSCWTGTISRHMIKEMILAQICT
jgi:hypothetical protein